MRPSELQLLIAVARCVRGVLLRLHREPGMAEPTNQLYEAMRAFEGLSVAELEDGKWE
jgi:hypothetical protein